MIVLMILKITLSTLIFVKQDELLDSIPRWLNEAFAKDRDAFHEIEKSVSIYIIYVFVTFIGDLNVGHHK